jgi:ABC-type bacteriocin/lantibiotic exporter with double-glycine peptidase domain
LPRPPHFFQTYPISCVPACLRMVLASLDFEISELELRNSCKCDETGTSPSNAVKAANSLGFDAYEANLIFEELEDLIRQNITPIVYTRVSKNAKYSHAVVVYKISKEKVFVLDPAIGERKLDINEFVEIWSRGSTIVVEKAL